jgi:hypothetical protein
MTSQSPEGHTNRINANVANTIETDATIRSMSLLLPSPIIGPTVVVVSRAVMNAFYWMEKNFNSPCMNAETTVDFLGSKMAPVPHPEFKYLWIGSKADAADLETLKSNDIHFIVNCTRDHLEGGVKNFHEGKPGMRYLRIPLKDNDSEVSIGCELCRM